VSAFLDKLDVTLLDDASNDGRGAWQLHNDFRFQSDVAGQTITVPAGFVTDFASVPRFPFTYWLFGDTSHEAAVVHDWLYKSKIIDRALADAVLKEASAAAGVPAWRRWGMYLGVRIGGGKPWEDDHL
jgi:hypothetical protein